MSNARGKLRLGVNIDHVATVRNARGSAYPDPVRAAKLARRPVMLRAVGSPDDARPDGCVHGVRRGTGPAQRGRG